MPTVRGMPTRRRERRSPVAERKGKFSALADLHRQPIEEEAPAMIAAAPSPPPQMEAGKGRGRPAVGKRSNPEWKLYSHYLKKQTQRAAVARLQAEESDSDLSDVLEELLTKWLKR